MKTRTFLLSALTVVTFTALVGAQSQSDLGILVNYGPTPLAMIYNGGNGNAVVASRQVAVSSLSNNFNSAVRADIVANGGGAYSVSTQSAYFGVNSQALGLVPGQFGGYWGWVSGLSKGNTFFGNGAESCYGGGEVGLPSSTPECSALGEFESDQGTYIWSGTISGSPSGGATTISYTSPTNNTYLGSRFILNLNQVTGGTGTISGVTTCSQGSGAPCPGTCPDGVGSECSVVQFAGASINTTAGLQWYFKTGNQTDYYSPACTGDDVSLPNGGGVGVPKCVGHWYNVAQVNSANQITLRGTFDVTDLGQYTGTANYLMLQGIEATSVNQASQTITIPANSFTWANGNFLYSPPNHYQGMIGANLIFTKQYKTGSNSVLSAGVRIANFGPQLMDDGILITGGAAGAGNGGFRKGIDFENLNILTSGPSGTVINNTIGLNFGTDVNYLLLGRSGSATGPKNAIALGNSGQDLQFFDTTTATHEFLGVPVQFNTGIYNDGAGFKHKRLTTGSILASATTGVVVTWTTTMADANYTPVCSVLDASGNLSVQQITSLVQASITVNVKNADGANPHTGTLLCHAAHD